jgi:thiol-disulfide isomerase/thioredoxin
VKKLFIFIPVILVIAAIAIFSFNYFYLSKIPIEPRYGDEISSKIKMFTVSNNAINITQIKGKNKVIFYLQSSNPDCIERLYSINKLMKVFDVENVSYTILWEDKIPEEEVKKAGIDININYCLKGKRSFSQIKPEGYILDESNKVILRTGYSYGNMFYELHKLGGNKDLRDKVYKMILNDVFKGKEDTRDKNKLTLLMFINFNCKKCKDMEKTFENNVSLLQSKFNTISIRTNFDKKTEYDKLITFDDDTFVYLTSFNDKANYPYFAAINQNGEIVSTFEDLNQLLKYVRNQ